MLQELEKEREALEKELEELRKKGEVKVNAEMQRLSQAAAEAIERGEERKRELQVSKYGFSERVKNRMSKVKADQERSDAAAKRKRNREAKNERLAVLLVSSLRSLLGLSTLHQCSHRLARQALQNCMKSWTKCIKKS
ncbi:hypothetical protein AGMMS49921_07030 [Endomicrobiia bacterium]|nr:hypothetical protein AGMMS49921_07030 [Endomicrobiia bacterium]